MEDLSHLLPSGDIAALTAGSSMQATNTISDNSAAMAGPGSESEASHSLEPYQVGAGSAPAYDTPVVVS